MNTLTCMPHSDILEHGVNNLHLKNKQVSTCLANAVEINQQLMECQKRKNMYVKTTHLATYVHVFSLPKLYFVTVFLTYHQIHYPSCYVYFILPFLSYVQYTSAVQRFLFILFLLSYIYLCKTGLRN